MNFYSLVNQPLLSISSLSFFDTAQRQLWNQSRGTVILNYTKHFWVQHIIWRQAKSTNFHYAKFRRYIFDRVIVCIFKGKLTSLVTRIQVKGSFRERSIRHPEISGMFSAFPLGKNESKICPEIALKLLKWQKTSSLARQTLFWEIERAIFPLLQKSLFKFIQNWKPNEWFASRFVKRAYMKWVGKTTRNEPVSSTRQFPWLRSEQKPDRLWWEYSPVLCLYEL